MNGPVNQLLQFVRPPSAAANTTVTMVDVK
jgi:hypothetical protein